MEHKLGREQVTLRTYLTQNISDSRRKSTQSQTLGRVVEVSLSRSTAQDQWGSRSHQARPVWPLCTWHYNTQVSLPLPSPTCLETGRLWNKVCSHKEGNTDYLFCIPLCMSLCSGSHRSNPSKKSSRAAKKPTPGHIAAELALDAVYEHVQRDTVSRVEHFILSPL